MHDLATVDSGTGTDVDDPVRRLDGLFIVLHDDQGVAEVAQGEQRLDQAAVVALVQTDRRLIEHVEHAGQPRADLRRQPDALRLSTGEGARRTAEVQVRETDLQKEVEAEADLAEHLGRDLRFTVGEGEGLHESARRRGSDARPRRWNDRAPARPGPRA